ncbi:hypothetical protein C8J56DRAFT_918254 [Mycena floridula]|nr:hypothetical protein C8J56DRAFT_918254 [Mycena floridula]
MSVSAESSGRQTKPPRNSLMRAFVDVIKQDSSRDTVKRRESQRLNSASLRAATAPRASLDSRPSPPASRRSAATPDKTITRRRASAVIYPTVKSSSEDQKPAETIPKPASLRPRPGTSSGLPKYRPKSIVQDPTAKRPASPPVRAGVRRRFSTSDDDEKEDRKAQTESESSQLMAEKASRPISPLPHRAAFKVNLTSVVNSTPPPKTTPTKPKTSTPSSTKASSPARPSKFVKTAPSTTIPRPSSSSSSSGSFSPKPSSTRHVKTPSAGSSRPQESPLARHSKKASKSDPRNMSLISEGNSEDIEAADVARLLAPVAALGAPTPAMPRFDVSRKKTTIQTPTKQKRRADSSYTAALPPDTDSPPSLRLKPSPNSGAPRGSILSFEQLANTSQTLQEEDVQSMLYEIDAPFRAGASSPPRGSMLLSVPESPCLSAMSSPGGFGSISQVLLPDVTPSPAVNHNHFRRERTQDSTSVDAAIVTLLRLQLSSAETLAKERLVQLQNLEEENHNLKQMHLHDVEELSNQVGFLEEQVRGNLEARDRTEDHAAHAASLEEQLRQAEADREHAVEEAMVCAKTEQKTAMLVEQQKRERQCSARETAAQWGLVRDLAAAEMDYVRGDREILTLLLGQLDHFEKRVAL